MREKRYSQLFQWLIILLSLFVSACSNESLEKKLTIIEQRVLQETTFGRQIGEYMKSKNTRYILDPSLPYQARYSIVDDAIHYNPQFNPSLSQWKQELLWGRPLDTILRFHEELHRVQVSYSERGAFFQFFWDNGEIDEQMLPNGKAVYEFTLQVPRGKEGRLLNFAASLVGYPILDIQTASEIVRQKMDEINAPQREKDLLKEVHAYLASDIVNSDEIYALLYETSGKGYDNLPRISLSELSNITELVVNLYGFYHGNHDKVCEAVGKSKSIKDFQQRAKTILLRVSSEELNQKVDAWILLKKEWTEATERIAKEMLK